MNRPASHPARYPSPEAELLICCARICMDSERAERIRGLLRGGIDWEPLIEMARSQGVLPLLYSHLSATCSEAVPEASIDVMRDYFHENARRNLYLTRELLRILKLFKAHGIPAIPFKGPALASYVYGNLALRQFCDLDILVHPHDVPKAKEMLMSQGYRAQFTLTSTQDAAFIQYECEHLLQRQEDGVIVEIHWRIVPGYFSSQIDVEALWRNLVQISVGGADVPTFAPDDLLLVLCVHGAKHAWERLGWICDIAELIRVHQGMEWGSILARARRLGSERMLFLGLFLAAHLLGAVIPEEALQRIEADPSVRALARRVRERLFRGANGSGLIRSALFHLRAMERLHDRVRYCLRLVVTPTVGDWTFLPLPAPLFPLYYPLRPIRLMGKYGLAAVRRMKNGEIAR